MKIKPLETVPQQSVQMEGAAGCKVRWLFDQTDGAPTFAMREFEVAPGGHTPRHYHPYEHEVFVLEGSGMVYDSDRGHPLKEGDVILVQPNEAHQFCNTGDKTMRFLCLIPNSAAGQKVTAVPECGVGRGE